jgi:hypothetical protein
VEERKGTEIEKQDVSQWFYIPSWKRSLVPVRKTGGGSRWLIFADEAGLGDEMVRRLRGEGKQVVVVKTGREYVGGRGDGYEIRTEEIADYERSLAEEAPDVIVHMWGVTLRARDFTETQRQGFYSLLHVGQMLGRRGGGKPVKLVTVTSGMQSVSGGELVWPEKATVLGPAKVLPQEYRNIRSKSVDLQEGDLSGCRAALLVDYLIAEAETETEGAIAEIAYRNSHRWVKCYERVKQEKTSGAWDGIEAGAIVLITGGTGGVGRTLAEYLALERKATVILTSRRGIDRSGAV